MQAVLPLLLLALAGAATWLALRVRRASRRRQQAISQLLDAADALESRLRAERAEIEAVAGSDENPVRAAMQDLLRQRLWLQEHGSQATLTQLDEVRRAIEAARSRVELQLNRIDRAKLPSAR